MANDWFKFRCRAGSFTGTNCTFFVQVAFVGRNPGRRRQGRLQVLLRDWFALGETPLPRFAFADGPLCPYASKES
jgi:hypothetical protein